MIPVIKKTSSQKTYKDKGELVMTELRKTFNRMKWDRILTAILAIVVGVLFIVLPNDSADVLCIISGIMLIVAGIAALVGFVVYGYLLGGHLLILGIALALAGTFCLVNPDIVKGLLTVIFGIFVVVDGSVSIADSIDCARAHIKGWFVMLLLSVVTVGLGVVVMFGTFDTVMIVAGISLAVDGLCDLIMTFVFSHRIREAKKALHEVADALYLD